MKNFKHINTGQEAPRTSIGCSLRKEVIKPLSLAIASTISVAALPAIASDFAIEEIIVTAQKREQSLQEIPMSVSALSSDTLKNSGIESVEDIKTLVPALNIFTSNSPAQSSISIRGAGTSAADPTLEPSVGVFVDGVFMPRSIFGLSDLVDIDRVEILLGPQGTLYGKNTNSGVISVHTKGAPESFEMDTEQTFGDYDLQDTKLSLGGMITDELGYRFAARNRRRDGWIEDVDNGNEYNQIDKQSYRGQLFWNPNDQLSVRAIAYHSLSDSHQSQDEVGLNTGSAYYAYVASHLAANGLTAPNSDVKDRKVTPSEGGGGRVEVQGTSVQVDYDFDSFTLTSITAYQEWEQDNAFTDNDGTRLDISSLDYRFNEQNISQEIRITSPGGETIDWVGGFFYYNSDLEGGSKSDNFSSSGYGLPGITTTNPLGGPDIPLHVAGDHYKWHQTFKSESYALFGQATWNITDATSLTAGLRYGYENKEFTVYTDSFDADGTPFRVANLLDGSYTGGVFLPSISGQADLNDALDQKDDRSETDVTGMLSLSHFIGDQMVYATIATGSKSGGFNGAPGSMAIEDRAYDTEETTNYEIGTKLDLWDGRARVNLAYFYTEYKSFQATTFDPVTVEFGVINAGKQVTQGVDLDATVMATENLTLSAKVEYLDARYKDFTGANCAPTSGEFIDSNGDCVLDGERMEYAPNWSGSVSADYIYPLDASEIYVHGDLSFKTKHISDPTRSAASVDTRQEIFNARLGWRNDSWDISLWGKNLTNDQYATAHTGNFVANVFATADGGLSQTNYRRWLNEPSTWGLTLRYSM
jgi:iron complex outermembrane recepter protein